MMGLKKVSIQLKLLLYSTIQVTDSIIEFWLFAKSWDDLDDLLVEAQGYFAKMDPTMMTAAWKISHTGDAVYAVRRNAKEGYISQ